MILRRVNLKKKKIGLEIKEGLKLHKKILFSKKLLENNW